jgi:DsbC/DsbD-like thiol-disulfide interchange protein
MSAPFAVRGTLLLACAVVCSLADPVSGSLDGQDSSQLSLLTSSGSGRAETRHLTLTTSANAREMEAGGRVTLYVDIAPKPGMHVYSPEQKSVIPVGLTIDAGGGVRPGATTFPKPEKYFFAPLKETQFVYSRPFRLAQQVTLDGQASTARATGLPLTIKGTLRYQACDDAICYLPQNVPVSWTIGMKP